LVEVATSGFGNDQNLTNTCQLQPGFIPADFVINQLSSSPSPNNKMSRPPSGAKARILEKSDNDVVIVYAIRSAITKVSISLSTSNDVFTENV